MRKDKYTLAFYRMLREHACVNKFQANLIKSKGCDFLHFIIGAHSRNYLSTAFYWRETKEGDEF